jgi:hypothetical protein
MSVFNRALDQFISSDAAVLQMLETVRLVADTDATVLISGGRARARSSLRALSS